MTSVSVRLLELGDSINDERFLSPFQGSDLFRGAPGAARNALAPGYLLPRLRR